MPSRWHRRIVASCAALGMACFAAACSGSSADVREMNEGEGSIKPMVVPAELETCDADTHETNDDALEATSVEYANVYFEVTPWTTYGSAYTGPVGGSICASDEDWFLLSTANLPYSPGWLSIRLLAADASHCPAFIEDYDENGQPIVFGYDPPSGPENTVQVDVYSAGTLGLIASNSSSIGRIFLDTFNGPLNQDLYLRVHGPAAASYSYVLSVLVQDDAYEDECEN
jgi:hypothetical protein